MNHSENINDIAAALAKAQKELREIPKSKTARAGSYTYQYADIADVLKHARPVLSDVGVAIVQSLGETETDGRYQVTTMLAHESGQWISETTPIQIDAGKMSFMQALGSATTYARRYALSAMLGIASDDDTDNAEAPVKGESVVTDAGTYLGKAAGKGQTSALKEAELEHMPLAESFRDKFIESTENDDSAECLRLWEELGKLDKNVEATVWKILPKKLQEHITHLVEQPDNVKMQ